MKCDAKECILIYGVNETPDILLELYSELNKIDPLEFK